MINPIDVLNRYEDLDTPDISDERLMAMLCDEFDTTPDEIIEALIEAEGRQDDY